MGGLPLPLAWLECEWGPEVSSRLSASFRVMLPGVFCSRGPAEELSAVIEFPCQQEMCHYTHTPMVYMHYPETHFLLLFESVGGNRLMSE